MMSKSLTRKLEFNTVRVFGFFSDIHVGSMYSVFPEDFVLKEGNPISKSQNKGQTKIRSFWNDAKMICDREQVDTFIMPGDLVHGYNYKQQGAQTITPVLQEQKRACVQLLNPLVKDKDVHVLSGSPYHESRDTYAHEDIANELQKVAKTSTYKGLLANLTIEEVDPPMIINVTHGVSSAKVYRTTLSDREALFQAASYGMGEIDFLPDIILRGHWHTYYHLDFGRQHIIQIPGWSTWTPWRGSVYLYGRQCKIGFVILYLFDDRTFYVKPYLMDKIPRIADFTQSI